MNKLRLESCLHEVSVPPPLPPGGVQTGQGDWTVSGIKTGFSLVDAFTDYAFEGEYSHTSLEWVPLKAVQRVCQSEDDVICCSASLADKDGSTRPLLTIKKVSMADVEEEKGAAKVWIGLVELDRKADLDSDPFGTLANVFNVEVETDKMSKVVKGKAEDVALQIKVILS